VRKLILVFGYGRWNKVKEGARDSCLGSDDKIPTGLHLKSESEIKAFSNSFLRAICDNLNFERWDLKLFLLRAIEENPGDPYVSVNASKPILHQKTGTSI